MNRDYLIKLAKKRNEPSWVIERRLLACAAHVSAVRPNFKYGLGVTLPASKVILPDGEPSALDIKGDLPDSWRLEPLVASLGEAPGMDAWLALEELGDSRVPSVVVWQTAFGVGEYRLAIPDGFSGGEPVRLQMSGVGNSAGRLVIDLGASSDVSLFIDAEASGSAARQIDVYARSGSRLTLFLNYRGEAQSFNGQRIYAEAGAHVKVNLVQSGGAFCQLSTRARLAGELAALRYRALVFGNGRGMIDESCQVVQAAEATHADVRCGAVLGRGDKMVSQARLVLEPDVTGSTAEQRSAALLVAEGAEYAAKPEFEARHDQLQCVHGAAVSGVNPERLFYLMSRGLSRVAAMSALVESFSAAYAADFADAGLSEEIADIMKKAKEELITEAR